MQEYKTILFGVRSYVCLSHQTWRETVLKHYLPFKGLGLAKHWCKEKKESNFQCALHFDSKSSEKTSLKVFKAWFPFLPLGKQINKCEEKCLTPIENKGGAGVKFRLPYSARRRNQKA